MQEKLAITVLVIMLALFALILVLYNLIKDKGEAYNQIVLSHQDYESRSIPYRRGNIVDRNGTYLAISEKVYNMILDPKLILETEENYQYLDATLDALVECFGYERDTLLAKIQEKKDSQYVVYEKQIPADAKESFESYQREQNTRYRALPTDKGGNQRITGVWFEEEYKRTYPYNELACNVIGFALKDGNASGGVEQYYNDVLTGVSGREYGYLNDDSNVERTVKPAQNGKTLELTLDVNIQKIVQKYLDEWQGTVGSNLAAAIVMDPKTGEILAMDTTTRFDLNKPDDLSAYYTEEELNAMSEEEKAEACYKVWRNFCVSDTYEPGSPQKAFTVAGAIEEGAISGNEVFECGGKLHFGDWDIRCVARAGHGPLTITQGLMKSCNVVMMRIVSLEGKEKFVQYQKIFGFGGKTGIDLPAEASGLIYEASNMDPASLATNAFGQNYNCTMVQMAAGYASLINGGSYYEPHLVKEILNDEGSVVKENEPKLVRETVSESTSNFINNALYLTVSGNGGTAGAAAVAGYEVAGKTGTAQKQPRAEKNYLVSFIGYAPAYDPQVLCYVVIDTPHLPGEQQAHSSFASAIFSKIMAEVLPYKNVFPAGDAANEEDINLAGQEEGIISGTAAEDPNAAGTEGETPAETTPAPEGGWANYDEEFIDSGNEYNYPDTIGNIPTEADGANTDTTAASVQETAAETETQPETTQGAGTEAETQAAGEGNATSETDAVKETKAAKKGKAKKETNASKETKAR